MGLNKANIRKYKKNKRRRRINKKIKKYKKPRKYQNYEKKNLNGLVCSYLCNHEKCHHLKFIRYLRWQKNKFNINFYASLIPYQRVYHPKIYGILNGLPDFCIILEYKDKKTGRIKYKVLYIELKCGKNPLTKSEKIEIKSIMGDPYSKVGVCYGYKSCKELMMHYRKGDLTDEELEKLCWNGPVKRKHVI